MSNYFFFYQSKIAHITLLIDVAFRFRRSHIKYFHNIYCYKFLLYNYGFGSMPLLKTRFFGSFRFCNEPAFSL